MKYLCRNKITLVIIVFLSFYACDSGPVKVGLLMHDLKSERWVKDKNFITERVEELGGELILKVANNDQQVQNQQALELLQEDVDVLIVASVDQNESAKIVNTANEKEVKVIAYDRLIKDCLLDYYVAVDGTRVGEMQAEYMTTLVPQGNYALILGDKKDNNSMLLFLGQMNVLQSKVESGDIRMIYSEFTDSWKKEQGYAHTKEILSLKDSVDVIICGSDELVVGVNEALEEANLLGKVKVISQDAELHIVQQIVKGNQAASIYKPVKQMGYKAAELAIDLGKGKEIKKDYTTVSNGKRLVPTFQLEPMLVNENTISSTVIAEGYHRSEDIY
ncbi:substrate-binding domain-containing protein [Sunxiuqinia sp. A32]|uniref:substrate-binding domain-containing protein n=1 Tax=Sunxiuqinia sp. A32 TaxID=3461496 RepID=UPI00404656DB